MYSFIIGLLYILCLWFVCIKYGSFIDWELIYNFKASKLEKENEKENENENENEKETEQEKENENENIINENNNNKNSITYSKLVDLFKIVNYFKMLKINNKYNISNKLKKDGICKTNYIYKEKKLIKSRYPLLHCPLLIVYFKEATSISFMNPQDYYQYISTLRHPLFLVKKRINYTNQNNQILIGPRILCVLDD